MLEWDETFATGHARLDAEHRKLFACVNELEQALKDGVAADLIVSSVLFLATYAQAHFEREEGIMERARCPSHRENCRAHTHFRKKVGDWIARLNADPSIALIEEIHRETSGWLTSHILKIDCQMRGCAT
jgi:hemerythrin-like metal-binding protein